MITLVIAPHPDDEIIGVGATIAKRIDQGNEVHVLVMTQGSPRFYTQEFVETEWKETQKAHKILNISETHRFQFQTPFLDAVPKSHLNNILSDFIKKVNPDEVFIPHRGDMHMEHQIVADAAMVALRPRSECNIKRIYSYEVLSETDWNIPNQQNAFIPNIYEDITEYIGRKLDAMKAYKSQCHEYPEARSIEAIEALAKHRGAIVGVKAAEAFMTIREVRK